MDASAATGSLSKSAATSNPSCSSAGALLATSSANGKSGDAQASALQFTASHPEPARSRTVDLGQIMENPE
jgi:hypothetical protein